MSKADTSVLVAFLAGAASVTAAVALWKLRELSNRPPQDAEVVKPTEPLRSERYRNGSDVPGALSRQGSEDIRSSFYFGDKIPPQVLNMKNDHDDPATTVRYSVTVRVSVRLREPAKTFGIMSRIFV